MDLIVRNARLAYAPDAPPVDIGVANGRIVALERNLGSDAESFDAAGNLACAGFVETHIHLDKSCIVDRAPPAAERQAAAFVAAPHGQDHGLAVADRHDHGRKGRNL